MEGNYIVIKPQQKAKPRAHGKKIKVRGVVKDETGEPVIGATVMEKGTTTNGVVTDIDGNYTIEIPQTECWQYHTLAARTRTSR